MLTRTESIFTRRVPGFEIESVKRVTFWLFWMIPLYVTEQILHTTAVRDEHLAMANRRG